MNRMALLGAQDYMIRAQKILQMEGSVVAEDLDEPIKQLGEQIKEITK